MNSNQKLTILLGLLLLTLIGIFPPWEQRFNDNSDSLQIRDEHRFVLYPPPQIRVVTVKAKEFISSPQVDTNRLLFEWLQVVSTVGGVILLSSYPTGYKTDIGLFNNPILGILLVLLFAGGLYSHWFLSIGAYPNFLILLALPLALILITLLYSSLIIRIIKSEKVWVKLLFVFEFLLVGTFLIWWLTRMIKLFKA